jgi:tetratricopeptide (TPR) repeat protein
MARIILTVLLVVIVNVVVGCSGVDSGKSQLEPAGAGGLRTAEAVTIAGSEADIVEQMMINRLAYRQGLEALIKEYGRTGNNTKLVWAQKELAALDSIPKYSYVIEAGVAGADLRATNMIVEADYIYKEGVELQKRGEGLLLIKDDNLLRSALVKYNELIKMHPSSDKIDDAAFKAAGIYEHFQDYSIAVVYYKRAFQWDPETPYPARFKAAYILDRRLHRRAEALELYQEALRKDRLSDNYREFAQIRIGEITSENNQ